MQAPFLPPSVKILSVAELTRELKGLLEEAFPTVWVTGQISNCKRHASGHIYLTLKDAEAQIKAVMWRSTAWRLRFEPRDGLEVIARGRLEVYLPRGEYSFIIEQLYPKGLGALELALRQLRDKLFQLGYFDPKRKKPLPRFPRRLALVTSSTGAAIRDVLEILSRRWPAVEVWVCPVRVQGDGAAEEIARAIQQLSQLDGIDVLIVGRGGGSVEDLWPFNEEIVAQAIFTSRIPVISAVGHEVDVTLADLVADRRALTPSEAAELAVPSREEIQEGLSVFSGRLRHLLRRRLELARGRLTDLAERGLFGGPWKAFATANGAWTNWRAGCSGRCGKITSGFASASRPRPGGSRR